jgi:Holliday junction resolvase
MTPEGKVKARVKKILDERGVYYFMPATGGYGRSGIPDFICCYNGKFMAIECKAGKGDLTALQTRELTRIDAAGGEAVVVRETSMDNFIKFLGFFK